MTQHITVVYFSWDNPNPNAFHVLNATQETLQEAFDKHEVFTIKCITIETETDTSRTAETLFLEDHIENFLSDWVISI